MSNALQMKRKTVGLTQAQIAKLAGITERGYRRYEASESAKTKSLPDVLTAIRITKALGVDTFTAFCDLWDVSKPQAV